MTFNDSVWRTEFLGIFTVEAENNLVHIYCMSTIHTYVLLQTIFAGFFE
jgi:hypothetical protein